MKNNVKQKAPPERGAEEVRGVREICISCTPEMMDSVSFWCCERNACEVSYADAFYAGLKRNTVWRAVPEGDARRGIRAWFRRKTRTYRWLMYGRRFIFDAQGAERAMSYPSVRIWFEYFMYFKDWKRRFLDSALGIFALIGMILAMILLGVLLNVVTIPCECTPHPEEPASSSVWSCRSGKCGCCASGQEDRTAYQQKEKGN